MASTDPLDVGSITEEELAKIMAGQPTRYNPENVKNSGTGTMTNAQRDAIIADSKAQGYQVPPTIILNDVPAGSSSSSLPLTRKTTKGTPEQQVASTTELNDLIAKNKAATELFQQALIGGSKSYATAGDAALKAGDAAATANTIGSQIEIAKLLQKTAVNTTFNLSVQDPDSVIVASQKARKEAQIKMDMLRPVIDEEDKVNVWDDPLRWIANQFTLPNLKKEYNQANRVEKTMVQRMATTQQLAASQQAVDPALVVDQIGQQAASQAVMLKYKSLEEASKLSAESSSFLARAVQSDIVFNDRSWEQASQLRKQFQDSLSYSRLKGEDEKQVALDKKYSDTLDAVNTKLHSINMPAIDLAGLKTLGAKKASALLEWGRLPTLGNGPGEAMSAIREFGSDQALAEADMPLAKFINGLTRSPEYTQITGEKANDPKFQVLSFEEKREAIVQEVYHRQVAALAPPKGSAIGDNSKLNDTNPYKLVHLNSKFVPAIKDNEFVKDVNVIAAASTNKSTVTDKDMLLSYLGKVQADPQNLAKYAKELSDYYVKSVEFQWAKTGPMMTGYPRPKTYGITNPQDGKVINAMSPIELENWAQRRLAAKLAGEVSQDSAWGSSFGLSR